ncbi:MAG: hypothetical protein V7637_4913 [Mycobacteriales bacterium]
MSSARGVVLPLAVARRAPDGNHSGRTNSGRGTAAPEYTSSEAISCQIFRESQDEVDDYWTKLTAGGEEGPCGWLKDKSGLSWQVVPTAMAELLGDPDPARSQRAMHAMLQMKKIDVNELRRAADQA